MRQDNENRGAIVQFPEYSSRAERFCNDVDTFKKFYEFKTFGPERAFGDPIILIPGLVYGLPVDLWKKLDAFRKCNNLNELRVYIATWEEKTNLDYLRVMMRSKTSFKKLKVEVQTWSYEGKEFVDFIKNVCKGFNIEYKGNFFGSSFKRYVTPFIYNSAINWISDIEDNPLVIKSRAATGFSFESVKIDDCFERMRWTLPFQFSNKQITGSNFGRDFYTSTPCSNSSIGDIAFASPLSTLRKLFSYNFLDNLISVTKEAVEGYGVTFPSNDVELEDFTSTDNYLAPFDGPVWIGAMLDKLTIPYFVDSFNYTQVTGRVYRLDIPKFHFKDNKLIKKGEYKVRGNLPQGVKLLDSQLV